VKYDSIEYVAIIVQIIGYLYDFLFLFEKQEGEIYFKLHFVYFIAIHTIKQIKISANKASKKQDLHLLYVR